ncbi:uncharacterized protein ACJ7VT_013841 [Polymixia lowei]
MDAHGVCYWCLGGCHAARALKSGDCHRCAALPQDELLAHQASFVRGDLSEDELLPPAVSVRGTPPMRELRQDFPRLIRAAAEAKGIPLPSPPLPAEPGLTESTWWGRRIKAPVSAYLPYKQTAAAANNIALLSSYLSSLAVRKEMLNGEEMENLAKTSGAILHLTQALAVVVRQTKCPSGGSSRSTGRCRQPVHSLTFSSPEREIEHWQNHLQIGTHMEPAPGPQEAQPPRCPSEVRHSLKYIETASSGVPNLPEFVAVGIVDEVQMVHYDSNTQRTVLKQDWMNKLVTDNPQYLENSTKIFMGAQKVFKDNINVVKQRFNQTGGVHIIQAIFACEWDDETGDIGGYNQYGYDGEDWLALNLSKMTWIAPTSQAHITKQSWDNDAALSAQYKSYFTKDCVEWLKKHVHYGKSVLQRTVRPSVSLLQKSPSSPVTCHATGFYPDRVKVFWRRDGEELHEHVDHGELLTNQDGTFQMSVDLDLSSVTPDDWKRYECVVQLSGVKDDIITKLDQSAIRTNDGEWLKKHVHYGKSVLQRTVRPSVSLLQKSPSSPVTCHATGFYPDRVKVFWRRDGEELHEHVAHGELLTNQDGTFQMSVHLDLSSVTPDDWKRYDCVVQLSGVKDDIITKLDQSVIRTNLDKTGITADGGFPTALVIGVVAGLILLVICMAGLFIWRKTRNGFKPANKEQRRLEEDGELLQDQQLTKK